MINSIKEVTRFLNDTGPEPFRNGRGIGLGRGTGNGRGYGDKYPSAPGGDD